MVNTNNDTNVYSVSKLVQEVQVLLEEKFSIVWIYGEISNLFVAASGHSYFTLKDEESQISSIIFKRQNLKLNFKLENGLQIIGLARISVYKPKGAYQLVFENIEPYGIGSAQLHFEQTKKKLQEKGYFDEQYKKKIPYIPSSIAIITSISGSVIHDFVDVVFRRFSGVSIKVVDARVQGEGADRDIASSIKLINEQKLADVIVLARGGGSIEDLSQFNSETLADAIFLSNIPIVSAIGHETDFTISDFVSDIRAGTPSIAGEIVVPDKKYIKEKISSINSNLASIMFGILEKRRNRVKELQSKLVYRPIKTDSFKIRLDDLTARLNSSIKNRVRELKYNNETLKLKIFKSYPNLKEFRFKINDLKFNLLFLIKKRVNFVKERQTFFETKINALNPTGILQRGYAITKKEDKVIRDVDEVSVGDVLDIMLAKGRLKCKVEKTYKTRK